MTHVSLTNIKKSYDDISVIPDLNLNIEQGEFVVLVGPSGCGKTTTLRMIAGLETVTDGHIAISDRDVTYEQPGTRNCAMVFQNYALYPHMTVYDNIAYGMKVRKEPADVIKKRVSDASALLGIDALLDRKPRHLSGGQRQRVAIGRAIVRHPDLFLFDEPLSNLDAKLRVEMRTEIKQLQRKLGTTAVYVTHDQVEAMTMADRVVVMQNGHIEQFSSPIEIYEKPANRFVAEFIGTPSMNFLAVTVGADATFVTLDSGETLDIASPHQVSLVKYRGEKVVIGIRPEHTQEALEETSNVVGILPKAIEPLGSHTLLISELAGEPFTAQVDSHFPASVGQLSKIKVDMSKAHYFDIQTEMRIGD
ncbi:sn-glycerol-3-phosphate import ATP-binding protein ugpC [Vibrio nigripulchritudo MADA3029]|uniref:ABC transporter ATP-binding protein n=1 Tax=Vibrio nigripulchritudo TaxID=28173 RepID=UPI0003B1D162|nr:sn-glycerol-3-phosphate ABC transporter ATP-binding protein UgpC [Vibrio nigripulchritudo]CCN48974.1 sn-glycerol-3-phosphate import ATP-binding protein ugpC [Vibrio nigripulchritudo MADA3020]CCN56164.1 sn-glycerol-3-phosphate import ATP-binding protein ugpC [Vibrio nigripulchritudo MADA3021]CCN59099.1 sn-glycerol-3-phosphate import ATP-binding protein ugpC [Vibrio nigripulchritudo MADA3029]